MLERIWIFHGQTIKIWFLYLLKWFVASLVGGWLGVAAFFLTWYAFDIILVSFVVGVAVSVIVTIGIRASFELFTA